MERIKGRRLGNRTKENLMNVNPVLSAVAVFAMLYFSEVDFTVTEGKRTPERQAQLVKQGASQTYKSYHVDNDGNPIDAEAFDAYPIDPKTGKLVTDNKTEYQKELWNKLNKGIQGAATMLSVKITWGGTWKTLVDMPHWQMEGY